MSARSESIVKFDRNDALWDELVAHTIPILERVAANEKLTDYTSLNLELARVMGGGVPFDFALDRDRAAVGAVLGQVVEQTHGRIGAMLSAVVKYMNDNDPGPGFYRLAESRQWLLRGEEHLEFWSKQLDRLYDYYAADRYDPLRDGRPSRRRHFSETDPEDAERPFDDDSDEPTEVDADAPIETGPNVPGPWRVSDGTPIAFSEAKEAWAQVAYDVLVATARRYGDYITYSELARRVLSESGIGYRPHQRNWIGKVLGVVAKRCVTSGEPPLSALCVSSDTERVGVGYEYVLSLMGLPIPEDLQPHAAESRLECYRFYGAELPPDGGRPTLTRKVAAARNKVRQPAPTTAAFCPIHHIQLPASGRCDYCD